MDRGKAEKDRLAEKHLSRRTSRGRSLLFDLSTRQKNARLQWTPWAERIISLARFPYSSKQVVGDNIRKRFWPVPNEKIYVRGVSQPLFLRVHLGCL